MKSFIEVQFPVSRLSKESYKERKANYSQTLTGLGKWWGRKPLVLVRATLLGLLMPASDDPRKDRDIFLKLMTMDSDGLRRRRTKELSQKELFELLDDAERARLFSDGDKPRLKKGMTAGDKAALQDLVFERMSYDDKLALCDRPEHVGGPAAESWKEINAHLGTHAKSLPELVRELGVRRFKHAARVGDAFCGGGSIPFEAARIGCEGFGSDLNPVAALLTWAALNIVGGDKRTAEKAKAAQKAFFDAANAQIVEWGIEHNENGWRADAYLYCNEVKCPECGWRVPLAPGWVIGEKTRCVAILVPDEAGKRYDLRIESGVSDAVMKKAKGAGTSKDGLVCPQCKQTTPMGVLRGDRRENGENIPGLRKWDNEDIVPRPEDVLQERLYCIRWVKPDGSREYRAPSQEDLQRERRVLALLRERFSDWQAQGYIPNARIEPGAKTDEPIRTRGWTHWHHLFNPRQLLVAGTLASQVDASADGPIARVAGFLGLGKCLDRSSRLCLWDSNAANEKVANTFLNNALNTPQNYGCRAFTALETCWYLELDAASPLAGGSSVTTVDARSLTAPQDIWITDPPYADAVSYHELSEFFLSWYSCALKDFGTWFHDSRRALAVVGTDEPFRQSMVSCYRNLAARMADDGMQVVMFTHQDASVWADLAVILWAAGLRVTAAWCIATETDTAYKVGNYVQGTVLLVLRKQRSEETAFLDDLYPQVEDEVKAQLQSMLDLDDRDEPNFGDADYQLAAYAAALRVLTQYKRIEEIDISRELSRARGEGEKSPVVSIIDNAVRVATDFLVPRTFDSDVWRRLGPEERLYMKGLEIESHGEYRTGVYMELARGLGATDYRVLLSSGKANEARLKTATEFEARELGDSRFGKSLVRHALYAVRETVRTEDAIKGRQWLKTELSDYWGHRKQVLAVLRYVAGIGAGLEHWAQDAEAARVLAGAVENDHV